MADDMIRFVGACCMQLVEENRALRSRVELLERSRGGLLNPVYTIMKRVKKVKEK